MSKAIEEFKAEVQSVTQRYKDKTEAEFHSKKLHWAWYVKPDSKYTSSQINNLYMHTQICALNLADSNALTCISVSLAGLLLCGNEGSPEHYKADFLPSQWLCPREAPLRCHTTFHSKDIISQTPSPKSFWFIRPENHFYCVQSPLNSLGNSTQSVMWL